MSIIFNKSYYYAIIKVLHGIFLNIDNNILWSEIKAIVIIIIKAIIKTLYNKNKIKFFTLKKKINNNLNKTLNSVFQNKINSILILFINL